MKFTKAAATAVPILTLTAFALASAAPIAPQGSAARPSAIKRAVAPKSAAVTTTTLYGGGATLPAIGYVGTVNANPQVTDTSGSAFYYYGHSVVSNEAVSYCQTGSGFGKKVLNGDAVDSTGAKNADLPCAALGTTPVMGTNGFGASGQSVADFVGSDAPLSSTEYSDFTTHGTTASTNPIRGRIEPVQLPAVAGSVAALYNNSDAAVKALANLPMSDKALCKVSNGTIKDWGALYDELHTEGLAVGSTRFNAKALYFVSRYDGSGTSFSYTNHLSAVCGSNGSGVTNFGANQTYSLIITANPSGAHFVGASGNPGVVNCIKTGSTSCLVYASVSPGTATTIPSNGDGAFGYVEAANAKAVAGSGNLKFATVNGKDPIKDLPAAAALVTASSLTTDMVVNQTTGGGGQPTTSPITPADKANCLVVVKPSAYANPSSGYPIIAVSNLDFSEKNNVGKSTQEQALAKMFYNQANFASGKITSIDKEGAATGATGFSSLNISSSSTIITTATACITNLTD